MKPAYVPHPGQILRDEIEERGMYRHEFAIVSKIPYLTIYDIIDNQLSISPDLATKIAAALGTSAEMWINLQKQYDEFRKSEK